MVCRRPNAKHGAAREAVMQAAPGIEPGAAWQAPRGELRETQFNITGDCHQVPQSQARLAWCRHRCASLRALRVEWQSTLCLAPRGACARGQRLTRCSSLTARLNALIGAVAASRNRRSHSQRACGASTTKTMPAHPGPRCAQRLAVLAAALRAALPDRQLRAASPRSRDSRRLKEKLSLPASLRRAECASRKKFTRCRESRLRLSRSSR